MHEHTRVIPATTMIGSKVVNPEGEQLGQLKDMVIDLVEGRINYAVLSFGGFLGLGDKLFAIPWEALALTPEDKTFILNVEKEQLKNAPGFDKDHWPDEAQYEAGWLLDVYTYYGYTPYWMSESERDRD